MTNIRLIEFVLYQPEQFIKINSKSYEPFRQRLFDISKDNQLNLIEWKNYLRDSFIPLAIEKLKLRNRQQTWVPEYYSGNHGAYLHCDFMKYYQLTIVLTQIGVDNSLIDEIINVMVQHENHNRNFGNTAKNWIIDDSMNTSIKENLWNDKFYSLVWFLDYDIAYESNTIKDQVNQEIDKIFTDLRNKIKQKLNDGKH
jgi:hypothetical protein